jgi:hypothetical protein
MAAVSRLADCTFDWQPVVYAGFEKVRPELLKAGTESKRLEELTSCNPWSAAWQCSRQTRDKCFGSSKRIVRGVWVSLACCPYRGVDVSFQASTSRTLLSSASWEKGFARMMASELVSPRCAKPEYPDI